MTVTGLTTPAVLDRVARELPNHPALVSVDRTLTFAQLRDEVRRAAATMIALGVEPAERVAIWSANTWHWVVTALAVHHAGAVVVPLNTNYTGLEATDILARAGVRLLFAMDRFPGTDRVAELDRGALPALRQIVRIPVGDGATGWDFLAWPRVPPAVVDARAAAVRPDDVSDILFTSGTTGRSKGVLCAHRQSLSASASAAQRRGMTTDDRYLAVAPFFHGYGYKDGILGCLQTGCTLVIQRTLDPAQIMSVVAAERVTILPGAPTLFQVLLDHPARADHDLSSLRIATTGGAPVPVALVERIHRDLGVQSVRTGYGLTEASGFGTTSRDDDDPVTIATTCGQPMAGFELRIDAPDEHGAGEVLLRGPNVMLGYLDDPEGTAEVIDADGWLHTGDVGTLDAAGNLRITDRLKDMYICGGLNVYPAEVEAVLAGMVEVAAAAVVGVPDPRLGEVGRAFVVIRPGAQLDPEEVIGHARRHLAGFKAPRSVVFLDELPRNAGGKVLKTALRRFEYRPPVPVITVTPKGLGGPPVGRVENWIADVWQALLNITRPGREDKFTDLGGDSLAAVDFSRLLHTQMGVNMSMDSLAERPTIAAVAEGLETGGSEQNDPVVQLRDDDTGPVLLMIPGVGGHAWRFTSLAQVLKGPCDIRAISLMNLRHGPAAEMRDRVRSAALDSLRPETVGGRPIMLAGYSFGAMIAADVACWLISQGVPVAKLILLDPDPLDSADSAWDPSFSNIASVPGTAAAQQLENEIVAMTALLQAVYLDGSIRLPHTAIAWFQSVKMAIKHQAATTIFGAAVAQIPKTVLPIGHHGMMRVPEVYHLAPWLDHQLQQGFTTG